MGKSKVKKVVDKIVDEGKNMSQAMREAGYSDTYSHNPHVLKKTESFQEAFDRKIKRSRALKVHKDLMGKLEPVTKKYPIGISDEDIEKMFKKSGGECINVSIVREITGSTAKEYKMASGLLPDANTRDKAIDKYYKIKGEYKEKLEVEDSTVEGKSLEELIAMKNKIEKEQSLIAQRYNEYAKDPKEKQEQE